MEENKITVEEMIKFSLSCKNAFEEIKDYVIQRNAGFISAEDALDEIEKCVIKVIESN